MSGVTEKLRRTPENPETGKKKEGKVMKTVILYWDNNTMYYVHDTENDSERDLKARASRIANGPGILSAILADETEIPGFAIDATN